MREDACMRTCQPDYIWSEKLKDFSIADVVGKTWSVILFKLVKLTNIFWSCRPVSHELKRDGYFKIINKAKTSLKGSITRIATFMDNVSEHVDITELEVKLKKIDQLQRKIEELKELLFGLETAKPTEEAEFEEDLYKCETRLDDLEVRVKN
ncbi:hypothetical protein TNCV_4235051 [Trichonephila clavipes]|nr:hypothetical protein TNCV_4235051 [Trichonephila clavipes]